MAQHINLEQVLAENQRLQQQLNLVLGRVGDLEKQEKARTASVYRSANGNLTFSWRKAGVFRSFLIPSKTPDGKISIARSGNIPADIRLSPTGKEILIQVSLPVDQEEAQLFNTAFTMQNQVIIQSGKKDATGTPIPVTPSQPMTNTQQWVPQSGIPTLQQPTTPVKPTMSPDQLVQEAQKLIDSGVPFASLADAVASVKKSRGLA